MDELHRYLDNTSEDDDSSIGNSEKDLDIHADTDVDVNVDHHLYNSYSETHNKSSASRKRPREARQSTNQEVPTCCLEPDTKRTSILNRLGHRHVPLHGMERSLASVVTPGRWAVHISTAIPPLTARHAERTLEILTLIHKALQATGFTGRFLPLINTLSSSSLHVSLTRGGVAVQQSNIEPMIQALTRRIRAARIQPFAMSLSFLDSADIWDSLVSWDIFPSQYDPTMNDSPTHFYLVWRFSKPSLVSVLSRLVSCCNDTLQAYGQLPYYSPPIFHVSLARLEVNHVHAGNDSWATSTTGAWISVWKDIVQRSHCPHSGKIDDTTARSVNHLTLKRRGGSDDGDSTSSDEDDDDDNSGSSIARLVTTVQCTFGTNQCHVIPLSAAAPALYR